MWVRQLEATMMNRIQFTHERFKAMVHAVGLDDPDGICLDDREDLETALKCSHEGLVITVLAPEPPAISMAEARRREWLKVYETAVDKGR
jgi:hypothetical protein